MTDMIAKDGVEAETVEAVKSLSGKYKYGFSTDIEKPVSKAILQLSCRISPLT